MTNAHLIDGKALAEHVKKRVKEKVSSLARTPKLVFVRVGDDPASKVYVAGKQKACADVGIISELKLLSEKTTENTLLQLIQTLNHNNGVDGILVQLPLPKHITESAIIQSIHPAKDVDGFHPDNLGKLVAGMPCIVPCTPQGIMEMIHSTGVSIEGKHAVVVGRSTIVGKPTALLLLQKHATVTICHSKTKNLRDITQQADILVAAVGKAKMITKDMVKHGAVVIDVGINRVDGVIVGDVDFENVKETAGWISPVPGGVGKMTVACLMENTVEAYLARCKK
ncbi:bifunctional methylenetetrahydrofolate dehydrogenase/methenyltetrahydrofolate cyclohydrolase FolD [Candidatus Woesearchaeota archaeon]|nr:bifunctional methylenetetrahydrofolate dehydrogenase/methenyltetrahydrofolate cyclohydrolase FolD [Candidatus Woesearchaeota archaeon]